MGSLEFKKRIKRRAEPEHKPEGLHPVIGNVLASRDIHRNSDLEFSNRDLLSPDSMGNINRAATVIAEHLRSGSRILIVGDYDADGATSCALGVLALGRMGANHVSYLVPDRIKFGYGLTVPLVDLAAQSSPDLIITVDNGIASIEGADRVREKNIALVITDHHLPGETLPIAEAIVNPNLPEDRFPSKNLAGVGVMFYVLSVVRSVLEKADWFRKNRLEKPNLAEYLDLVALGTYADLVKLDRNNRILVAQGLKRIKARKCRPGIQAIVEVSGIQFERLVAADLGFQVAPRLNAAGRIDDMSIGIECLLASDPANARRLAKRLDSINRERKEMEKRMQQQAIASLNKQNELSGDDDYGNCVFREDWHPGIVGLLASRLKERTGYPSFAFAMGEAGELKGSARSVPGIHIRDLLCEIDRLNPGLILRFGGHAMAAGLSISMDRFEDFSSALFERLGLVKEEIESANQILSDGALGEGELDDLDFIHQLRTLAPWGQGFPEAVFDNVFTVLQQKLVGEIHLKLVLRPEGSTRNVEAIRFRFLETPGAPCPEFSRIHAAYRLDINEFGGRISPQLMLDYFQPC